MQPLPDTRTCPCGATFTPRRSGRPQRWCNKKTCPAYRRECSGRSVRWYHDNRAYARAREQRRRVQYKASGRERFYELRQYGMNDAIYAAMLASQGGRCAICRTDTPSTRRDYFDIDHCHRTGKIRGLLCETCNRAIGLMKDDAQRLRDAADYVER